MQDAGAARNRRTENGPSGTPAPTGCATGDMARYVWAGCAHWGRSNAVRGSGSGDRSAGDSVRNPFAPQLQSDEREIQKPMVFGGVLFHISFAVERNMAAGGIHAGRGCNPQSENGKRAVGDAGPYGGIDESAPVFEGVPIRAVGDAGPYEGAAIEVRRYPKMYRCGYDNGARHHQRGTRERQRCQFKDSWRDLRAPPRGTQERQRG